MRETVTLGSNRLRLRAWRDEDLEPFAAMSADPQVMRFFPSTLTRSESNALAERIRRHFDKYEFGLWAVEVMDVASFVGFVGLAVPSFEAEFMPSVEIGWRIAKPHWGMGYATEAAKLAIEYGFTKLQLPEIVSFTVPENSSSRRVMEKVGMRHCPDEDFDHPALPEGHALRPHVLYRLSQSDWLLQSATQ